MAVNGVSPRQTSNAAVPPSTVRPETTAGIGLTARRQKLGFASGARRTVSIVSWWEMQASRTERPTDASANVAPEATGAKPTAAALPNL